MLNLLKILDIFEPEQKRKGRRGEQEEGREGGRSYICSAASAVASPRLTMPFNTEREVK